MSKFKDHNRRTAGNWWDFEARQNVGIWTINDWEMLFEEELSDAEAHYKEVADRDSIKGTVVAFDDVGNLSKDMQNHITEAWSHLAQQVDVERTAYVADGIKAMAVKSNVNAPQTELQSFENIDEAVEWAEGDSNDTLLTG